MTIWSLVTDTDAGISTSLHLTEKEAYSSLAQRWFSEPARLGLKLEMLAAIKQSPAEAGRWFASYMETNDEDARVQVEAHEGLIA